MTPAISEKTSRASRVHVKIYFTRPGLDKNLEANVRFEVADGGSAA